MHLVSTTSQFRRPLKISHIQNSLGHFWASHRSSQLSACDILFHRCINVPSWFSVAFVSTSLSWQWHPLHTLSTQSWGVSVTSYPLAGWNWCIQNSDCSCCLYNNQQTKLHFFKLKGSILLFSIKPQIVGPVSRSHFVWNDPALSFAIWLHESMSDGCKYISERRPWKTVLIDQAPTPGQLPVLEKWFQGKPKDITAQV